MKKEGKGGLSKARGKKDRTGVDMGTYQAFYESLPFKVRLDFTRLGSIWTRLAGKVGVHKLRIIKHNIGEHIGALRRRK